MMADLRELLAAINVGQNHRDDRRSNQYGQYGNRSRQPLIQGQSSPSDLSQLMSEDPWTSGAWYASPNTPVKSDGMATIGLNPPSGFSGPNVTDPNEMLNLLRGGKSAFYSGPESALQQGGDLSGAGNFIKQGYREDDSRAKHNLEGRIPSYMQTDQEYQDYMDNQIGQTWTEIRGRGANRKRMKIQRGPDGSPEVVNVTAPNLRERIGNARADESLARAELYRADALNSGNAPLARPGTFSDLLDNSRTTLLGAGNDGDIDQWMMDVTNGVLGFDSVRNQGGEALPKEQVRQMVLFRLPEFIGDIDLNNPSHREFANWLKTAVDIDIESMRPSMTSPSKSSLLRRMFPPPRNIFAPPEGSPPMKDRLFPGGGMPPMLPGLADMMSGPRGHPSQYSQKAKANERLRLQELQMQPR